MPARLQLTLHKAIIVWASEYGAARRNHGSHFFDAVRLFRFVTRRRERQWSENRLVAGLLDFRISVDIKAPAERVWAVMRDIERWPEWTPTVIRVRRLGDGPFGVGSRAVVWQPKLLPAKWEVTELKDQERTFTWFTRGPGLRVTAKHWVEVARDGSRAALSLKFSGPLGGLFARLTRKLNDRYLALEAKGLKERSENG